MEKAEEQKKQKRKKIFKKFVDSLAVIGAPQDILLGYTMQAENCYCAYVAGKMAADQLYCDGHLEENEIQEYTIEFVRAIMMKTKHAQGFQPTPQGGKIIIPTAQLPKDVN